jgi:hypothetical protein
MVGKTYQEHLAEDRRLALLRVLSEQPTRSMNSSNLDAWLRHLATTGSRSDTIDALRWLHDQALIVLAPVPEIPGLHVATLTATGLDVARGHVQQPGVAQPSLR